MLKRCAQEKSFAEMLHKCAPSLWFVVHKPIHSNWYKRCRVLIVRPVDMSVCRNLVVQIGQSDEQ